MHGMPDGVLCIKNRKKHECKVVVVSRRLVILVNMSDFKVTLIVKFINMKWVEFCTKIKQLVQRSAGT